MDYCVFIVVELIIIQFIMLPRTMIYIYIYTITNRKGAIVETGSPYYYHWLINDGLRELICTGIPCVNYQGIPFYSGFSGIMSIGYFSDTYPYGFNNGGSRLSKD